MLVYTVDPHCTHIKWIVRHIHTHTYTQPDVCPSKCVFVYCIPSCFIPTRLWKTHLFHCKTHMNTTCTTAFLWQIDSCTVCVCVQFKCKLMCVFSNYMPNVIGSCHWFLWPCNSRTHFREYTNTILWYLFLLAYLVFRFKTADERDKFWFILPIRTTYVFEQFWNAFAYKMKPTNMQSFNRIPIELNKVNLFMPMKWQKISNKLTNV
jgi:hypothetical protein